MARPEKQYDEEFLIHIIKPDNRFIHARQLINWANEVYDAGNGEYRPKDLIESIFLLEKTGQIVVDRYPN